MPVIVEEASNGALPHLNGPSAGIRYSLTLAVHLNGQEYQALRRRYPHNLTDAIQAAIVELLQPLPPSPDTQAAIDMQQEAV